MSANKLNKIWKWLAGFAALLLAGIVYLGISKDDTPDLNSLSSQSLYASAWPDAEGKMQALNQWQHKVSVINFWASWCQPCQDEMPDISAIYEKYAPNGLVVLGISVEEREKLALYANKAKVSYPLLAADIEGSDISSALGNNKGVLPYTAVIDAHGKVVKTFSGRIDQATLEATLLPLLKTP